MDQKALLSCIYYKYNTFSFIVNNILLGVWKYYIQFAL